MGELPDSGRLTDEAEVNALVAAIADGRDGITVPAELTGADPENVPKEKGRAFIAQLRFMSVPERIKLAIRGNKEVRTILLRDSNKIIVRLVLENPRITEDEIRTITQNRSADDELLRVIANRREWMKNYQVRLGLVTNPKTPMGTAVRLLSTLDDRDIRRIAKSKNVPDAVAGAARRMLANRQMRTQR